MQIVFYWIKWLLAILLGLPLLVYFLLLLVNISDEEKSDTVVEFEQFLAKRSTIDDNNNGFVYAVGLFANTEDDFYLAGLESIKQTNRIKSLSNPAPENNQLNISTINSSFSKLVAGCGSPIQLNAACNTHLLNNRQAIDNLLMAATVLIQRYEIMTSQSDWYESVQSNLYNIMPLAPWSMGHKLFMLHLWRQASKNKTNSVITLLQQDSVFWRNAILSTQSLLHFSLITSVIQENYQWGSFALKSFVTNETAQTSPRDWQKSLTKPTFSFNKIVIGEWQFASSVFQEVHDSDEWYAIFIQPLFNLQSTLNLYAEMLHSVSKQSHKGVKSLLLEHCYQDLSLRMLSWYSYNPLGKLLVCAGKPSFSSFQNKINEAEQTRLAVLMEP